MNDLIWAFVVDHKYVKGHSPSSVEIDRPSAVWLDNLRKLIFGGVWNKALLIFGMTAGVLIFL